MLGFYGGSPQATALGACVTPPAQSNPLIDILVPAGQTLMFPLDGYVVRGPGFTGGVEVVMGAALTGTAYATIEWYER